MKRKTYGRDRGLTLRMLATGGLLGLLYVVFAVVLFSALHVGLAPMLVIVIGLAVVIPLRLVYLFRKEKEGYSRLVR